MQEMFKTNINHIIEERTDLLPSMGAIFALMDNKFIETMADVRILFIFNAVV